MNLSFVLWLAVLWQRDTLPRSVGPIVGRWVICNVGVLLATAPVLYAIVTQRNSTGLLWMPAPSFRSIGGLLKDILFAPGPGQTGLWPGLAGLALAVAGLGWAAAVNLGRRRASLLAVVGLVLPLLAGTMMLAASFARPVLLPRTALWLTIPLYLFVATAIVSLSSWRMRAVAVALALSFEAAGLAAYWRVAYKDPWRDIVPAVAATTEADDVFVFLSAELVPAFAYYWPQRSFDIARCRLLSSQGAEHEYLPDETGTRGCHDEISTEAISERLKTGHAVWLIARGERNIPLLERLMERWGWRDAQPAARYEWRRIRIVRLVGGALQGSGAGL